ncbi:MAG: response regulator [Smithellaceae bacterium]|nr:response regulator [Smithellaceae bacterium]
MMMVKILAIDDRPDNLLSVAALINKLIPDCSVITAGSGEEGIARAKSELPDTILLYIKMPGMDGYETCRRIKGDDETHHIPIIMVAAEKIDPQDQEVGADIYLTKPYDGYLLAAQIKTVLRMKLAEDKLRQEKDLLEERVKERTAALRESEKRYRLLAENVTDVIWTMNMDLRLTYLSPSVLRFMGYNVEEMQGLKLEQILSPGSLGAALETLSAELAKESMEGTDLFRSLTLELEHVRKDGSAVWAECAMSFLRDSELKPVGILGTSRDITARRQMVEALRKSEEEARRLVEENRVLAKIGRIISSSIKTEEVYEQFAREFQQLIPCDRLCVTIIKPEEYVAINTYAWGVELPLRRPGEPFPLAGTISEEIMRTRQGLLLQMDNPDTLARFPGSAAAYCPELISLITVPLISRNLIIGTLFIYARQTDAYRETDLRLAERIADQIAGLLAITQLYAERERLENERLVLEERLRQSQKMEAIGTLAGGIAHDFNNILAGILGYAEMAGWDLPEGSRARTNLEQCIKSTYRARDLVQQILAFSRQSKQERRPLDIAPLIRESLQLLRASLPATIEIRQNIEVSAGIIMADPTEISQVLMNLCTNAAQAMGDRGGELDVSLTRADINGDRSPVNKEIPPGAYLKLMVSDVGHGMTPEVMQRIFDPYFTTREVGRGSGLGLSIVSSIVKNLEGAITVASDPGRGTTFDVYFPLAGRLSEEKASPFLEPLPRGRGERILFVDDEEAIVEVARQILTHLGYEITGSTGSVEALELFRLKPEGFDLVVTDLTMPKMTGDRLAADLRAVRPDIPVIISTGYSEYFTEERSRAQGIDKLVFKPLVMKDLACTVREVLDRRAGKRPLAKPAAKDQRGNKGGPAG